MRRSEILSVLALRERTITAWGGAVHIRELTAAQRVAANDAEEAVKAAGGAYNDLSQAAFFTRVIVGGVLDEPGGRPLFQEDDIPRLMELRLDRLKELGTAIWVWSEAHPDALKSGDSAPDGGQLDAAGSPAGADESDGGGGRESPAE